MDRKDWSYQTLIARDSHRPAAPPRARAGYLPHEFTPSPSVSVPRAPLLIQDHLCHTGCSRRRALILLGGIALLYKSLPAALASPLEEWHAGSKCLNLPLNERALRRMQTPSIVSRARGDQWYLGKLERICMTATSLPSRIGNSTGAKSSLRASKDAGMPYELAFTMRSPLSDGGSALSSDGKWLAYVVHTPPVQKPPMQEGENSWRTPNGTPPLMVGSRLFVTELGTGTTREVGPANGNSWRPSWSPDSQRVAFFSDARGVPQLWAYDLPKPEARRVSETPLMPSPWEGDEAHWSPDGTEVYVPLRPSSPGETGPEGGKRKRRTQDGLTVTVYGAGEEDGERADPAESKGDRRTEIFLRVHNATLGAINMKTGAVRIVVPAETTPRPAIPRLSPSGKWVSYLSVFSPRDPHSEEIIYDLAVAPSSGGPIHILASRLPVPNNTWGWTYRWHPSRDLLVYLKDRRL